MNYQVLLTYDNEYKGYVVVVPQLPDCVSHGKTLDEAIENIKDAIKGWILVEKQLGRDIPNVESRIFLGEVYV